MLKSFLVVLIKRLKRFESLEKTTKKDAFAKIPTHVGEKNSCLAAENLPEGDFYSGWEQSSPLAPTL
ncbi:hypothetical protein HY407_01460 [Candidatus Gottesmanbacteria bacterium]|nr:hypothetical protein [Candidatus Gottesmanbacteria bacterium]